MSPRVRLEAVMEKNVDMLLAPLQALLVEIGGFLPRLGLALVVLLVGVLVAKAARFAIEKGLRALNLHVVTRRSGMDDVLQWGGAEIDTVSVFGRLVYWLVILAALIVAFNSLGLAHVTELLGRLMLFASRIVVALLVLAFGSYFARFVGNAISSYCGRIGIHGAAGLGRLARYAVLVFVIMVALDQLDIGGAIVRDAFLIVLAGLVFALALAFGLGGRKWAAARLEEWWPSEPHEPDRRA
jgi:hypothetical protein